MLASIQTIIDINSIPGADAIEVASVLGWKVVVKKGMFKSGELVCYCQIDTVAPANNPYFDFLKERSYRIRTIKLRKQISQGLIIGLNELPVFKKNFYATGIGYFCNEGTDVTELIGITKFSKEAEVIEDIPKQPKSGWRKYWWILKQKVLVKLFPGLKQVNRAKFPIHLISITDEERIQNVPHVLDKQRGNLFYSHEKLNGSSITIIHEVNGGIFHNKTTYRICSRRFELFNTQNEWYRVFQDTDFKKHIDNLVRYYNTNKVIVQGEYIGKPQGNYHGIEANEIRLFNIYVDGVRVPPADFLQVTAKYGIPICPFIESKPLAFSMDEIKAYAKGKSMLNPKVDREGVVMRSADGSISFKVISDDYLLKNNE